MWESESKSSREAPEMLYRLLELNRQLKGKGLPVSWDDINERAAARSGAMLLRPNRAKYGTSKE